MGQQVKIRRATAASIASKTPVEAELGWVTDEKRLVVGDGITAGGVRVAMESDIPELGDYAPVDSPVLTGNPQAPTPSPGDNDQSIATTGFVKAAIDAVLGGVSATYDTLSELAAGLKGLGALTLAAGDILYATGANTLGRLAKSTNGYVLTLVGGLPAWAAPAAASGGSVRNRIVNPAMQISSINGNTSGTSSGYAPADNWFKDHVSSAGTLTVQRVQSVTPKGAKDRIRVTITAADASLAAGEYLKIRQDIAGREVADFQYGTASAKQVLLRFLFKGPQGTYAVALHNAAQNRSYVALFTISAPQANTDTIQEITIPGDTTGTWLTDTGVGLTLDIVLACGSTFQGTTGWQAGNILGTSGVSNGMATLSSVFEIGEVGLYLDVAAAGTFPTWELPSYSADDLAAMPSGIRKLMSGTVSSAAVLDIVLTNYTSYRGILVKLTNVIPVTAGANLLARLSTDGGSTYDAGAGAYRWACVLNNDDPSNANMGSTSSTSIQIARLVGNGAADGATAWIELMGQTVSAARTRIQFGAITYTNVPSLENIFGGGLRTTAQDTDAIRFLFSSGNIASGSYAVYGLV